MALSMNRKVVVALEHRFYRYNGRVYTKLAFPYAYWKDYLSFFSEVKVYARVKDVGAIDESYACASGPGVTFISAPYYVGFLQFIKNLAPLALQSAKVAFTNSHFILRSGNITNVLWIFLMLARRPYLREYPGNVREGIKGFMSGSIRAAILAHFLDLLAKIQGRFSKANSFVSLATEKLYSCAAIRSHVFSSFKIDEVCTSKEDYRIDDVVNLICLGRLEREKGHIDLLKAISMLSLPKKLTLQLTLIGDGSQRQRLEEYARFHKVPCRFLGGMTDRGKIFDELKCADIFVLPSHTEGMPRALLEAMVIGLPCVATEVGGVPEILNPIASVQPQSPRLIAQALELFISDPGLRKSQGERNKEYICHSYNNQLMEEKKHRFWGCLYE